MQIFISYKSTESIKEIVEKNFLLALGCLPAIQSDKPHTPPAEKIINIFIFIHYNFILFIRFEYMYIKKPEKVLVRGCCCK